MGVWEGGGPFNVGENQRGWGWVGGGPLLCGENQRGGDGGGVGEGGPFNVEGKPKIMTNYFTTDLVWRDGEGTAWRRRGRKRGRGRRWRRKGKEEGES